jgi:propionyl-CoA synthetase
LAVQIDDSQLKVIIGASCGMEIQKIIPYKPLIGQAIISADFKPSHYSIFQKDMLKANLQDARDLYWQTLMQMLFGEYVKNIK